MALLTAPFALVSPTLLAFIYAARGAVGTHDPLFDRVLAFLAAAFVVALPWGLLLLLVLPVAISRYAASGRPRDLFDPGGGLSLIRRRFVAWNLALAAIVTAWLVAVGAAAFACVGLVPGVFYAILVSAHATATITEPDPEEGTAPAHAGPPAG